MTRVGSPIHLTRASRIKINSGSPKAMTLAPLARRAPRALFRLPALASTRTHYTGTPHDHGGRAGGELRTGINPGVGQGSAPGPRAPLALGLETARAVTNLGRALETHAEASVSAFADMFESVWHADGLLFRRGDGDAAGWAASTAAEELASVRARRALPVATPALLSLAFADERTALVRLLGADGRERFLSMLRLDGAMMHDGWQIVREVVGSPLAAAPTTPAADDAPLASVRALLRSYLAIEHGGGAAHRKQAEALFAPRASLLAVGSAAADAPPSDWEAPPARCSRCRWQPTSTASPPRRRTRRRRRRTTPSPTSNCCRAAPPPPPPSTSATARARPSSTTTSSSAAPAAAGASSRRRLRRGRGRSDGC